MLREAVSFPPPSAVSGNESTWEEKRRRACEGRRPDASPGVSVAGAESVPPGPGGLFLGQSLALVLSIQAKVNAKPESTLFYAKAACQPHVGIQGSFAGPSLRFELILYCQWVFAGPLFLLVLRWEVLRCWY